MKWWQRFRRKVKQAVVADQLDSDIYGASDLYLDGFISQAEYDKRVRRALMVACDDCHRTDGTHDPDVEH